MLPEQTFHAPRYPKQLGTRTPATNKDRSPLQTPQSAKLYSASKQIFSAYDQDYRLGLAPSQAHSLTTSENTFSGMFLTLFVVLTSF